MGDNGLQPASPRQARQELPTIMRELLNRNSFMERYNQESPTANPHEAYEQNHMELLDLMGRINSRLAANYRADQPRASDHVGSQEELIAMLRDVADYLGA